MPESKHNMPTRPKEVDAMASVCGAALADTCKALKAISFYPENHPLRDKLLQGAYQAMANIVRTGTLSLTVQRNGLSFADPQATLENTPMTRALAQELFSREIQQLTLLPELSLADFKGFLSLLALDPQKVLSSGGLPGMLTRHGIATVMLNEIDISAVFTRRKAGEALDEAVDKGAKAQDETAQELVEAEGSQLDQLNELSVEELIEQMTAAGDDRYRVLARVLSAKGQQLRLEEEYDAVFTILAALAGQHADPSRSAVCHQYALMLVQQLAQGKMIDHLLGCLESDRFDRKEEVYLILNRLGGEIVDAVIARLVAVSSASAKKSLGEALLRIGSPALPALIALLKDKRWRVVHTVVAILGDMGSRDTVRDLTLTATCHADNRVRMESIRALARIGGMEATAVLIELLHDENHAIAIHAMAWLGNTRNHKAVEPLLQLVLKRDLLGKSQSLKKEALIAIGNLGDRRALEPLFRLVRKRHWIFFARWDRLKLVAVETIAKLGGESAWEFLGQQSVKGGELGLACAAIVTTVARKKAENND